MFNSNLPSTIMKDIGSSYKGIGKFMLVFATFSGFFLLSKDMQVGRLAMLDCP